LPQGKAEITQRLALPLPGTGPPKEFRCLRVGGYRLLEPAHVTLRDTERIQRHAFIEHIPP